MPRLKAALITFIVTLCVVDWIRARTERMQMLDRAEKALDVAERLGDQRSTCLQTLHTCSALWGSEERRTQQNTLVEAQTALLVRAAQNGDKAATIRLAELGWSWDDKRRVLQVSVASE